MTLDALLKSSRDESACKWSEGTDSTSLRGDSLKKHSEHSMNPIIVFTSHAYGNYDGSHKELELGGRTRADDVAHARKGSCTTGSGGRNWHNRDDIP